MDGIKWKVDSVSVDGAGAYEPTYSMGANRPLYVMIPYDDSVMTIKSKINEYLGNAVPVVTTEEEIVVENAESSR